MRKPIRILVYSLFVFALFFEWMVPLKRTTDTGRIDIFLLLFVVFLIIDISRLPKWAGMVVKPLFLALIVYSVFFAPSDFPFFSFEWIRAGWSGMKADFLLLQSADWMLMTPFVRTLFFLLFIWLMEAVMFRYVVRGGRVFWIFILTVFYLSALDSLTPFDGRIAIVRTFCYGFLMLAFSRLDQLLSQESFRNFKKTGRNTLKPSRWMPWFSAGFSFILLAAAIGLAAPKSVASWRDPISFITSYDERAKTGAAGEPRKVGYGEDDSRLGGPFKQDETVVFRSTVESPYYWRGEAKDLYDGAGWHRQQKQLHEITHDDPDFDNYDVDPSLFHAMGKKTVHQQTKFSREAEGKYGVLFTAGQLRRIHSVEGVNGNEILRTGNASGFRAKGKRKLTRYEVDVEQPLLNEEQLRESSTAYPDHIKEQYLQLPDDLPARVATLGEEIIKDETNVYDQVKAVESYLKLSSHFTYDTENVPVPEEGSDFVDHFLFETQRGYCDHFSTSMVVLLRANGIPARWVKGFAPGDRRYDLETGEYEVTVTNAHAHSWPEVYFEGVGWLPFEPTPSFNNPTEIEHDSDDGPADTSAGDLPEPTVPEIDNFNDIRLGNDDMSSSVSNESESSPTRWTWVLIGGVAILSGLGGALWLIKPRLWQWRIKRLGKIAFKDHTDGLIAAYERLLYLLGRRYGPRKPQQTVRDYVRTSATTGHRPSVTLVELTKLYEHTRYNERRFSKRAWQIVRERWKRLIEDLRM